MSGVTTAEAAYNDIFATFTAQWKQASPAIVNGAAPLVLYKGNITAKAPADAIFVRVSQQTVMTDQTALADAASMRRDKTSGIVIVQLFVPFSATDGDLLSRRLAVMCKKAFLKRSLSGKIWFRRARVVDLDPELVAHRRNIVAEYEYDELV